MNEASVARDNRRIHAAERIVAMCAEVALPHHQATLRTIAREISRSRIIAAGPAVRLAEAVWHGHYRRCHAETRLAKEVKAKLVKDETDSYDYLITNKQPKGDPERHHVWKGIQSYRRVRESLFGQGGFFFEERPAIGEDTSPLLAAIFAVDKLALSRHKPYLGQVRNHLLMVAPPFSEGVELLSAAVKAFEKWQVTRKADDREAYFQANKAILHYLQVHKFQGQLPLGEAASLYLEATNLRSQAHA